MPKSKPLYVGIIYHTERNQNCFNVLEDTLSNIRSDCDLLVLGDFNLCLLKNKSKLHKDYKEVLNTFNCKQLIKVVTRETDTSYSCLDHIFTNNEDKICQTGVVKSGLSDHYITFCTRKIIRGQIGKHNTIRVRSLRNYNIDVFLNRLHEVDWSIVTRCNNVNEAWVNFKNLITQVLDSIAPIKEIRIKLRTEPWIDDNILQSIRERDKLLTLSNRDKADKSLRRLFNETRNKLQRDIKKAKSNYFKNKVEENQHDSKKLWRHLKTLGYNIKAKDRSKIVLDSEGEKCHDSKTIAEIFKKYFLTVASNLVNLLSAAPKIFSTDTLLFKSYYTNKNIIPNSFILQEVTENVVLKELRKLNPKKSTGLDGINPRFLKDEQ